MEAETPGRRSLGSLTEMHAVGRRTQNAEREGSVGVFSLLTFYFSHLHFLQVAKVLWWYYFSKLIEFLDTIFFVLRKKTSQITFLHVYHHASMFNIWWCVLNWIPCGQSK